jgi:hypothetical protein
MAKIIPVFKCEDPLQTREATNLHLARQAFDIAGVRYEFGIAFAMKRFQTRGWKSMPRVNQLYNEEIILDMQDAWKIECRAKLQIPKHDEFKAENYRGTVTQRQFHEWVAGQVNLRAHKYMSIGQIVYVERVMPEHVAVEMFGEELVARGKRDALL